MPSGADLTPKHRLAAAEIAAGMVCSCQCLQSDFVCVWLSDLVSNTITRGFLNTILPSHMYAAQESGAEGASSRHRGRGPCLRGRQARRAATAGGLFAHSYAQAAVPSPCKCLSAAICATIPTPLCALQVVAALAQEQLLPAIVFLFSRRGCEQAVFTLHAAGVDLTSYVSLHTLADCLNFTNQLTDQPQTHHLFPCLLMHALKYFKWRCFSKWRQTRLCHAIAGGEAGDCGGGGGAAGGAAGGGAGAAGGGAGPRAGRAPRRLPARLEVPHRALLPVR
jgi:hypothetical protein